MAMTNTSTLLWGVLWGGIGVGYFMYGRKQRRPVPLVVGVALCTFPYFITNTLLLVGVGAVLTVVPYFFRL